MTSKSAKRESWRPSLSQRLSTLIGRRNSTRGKQHTETTGEDVPDFTPQQEKTSLEFKPLELEFAALQSFDLPDDWLATESEHVTRAQEQQPLPRASIASVTQITDNFASDALLESLNSLRELRFEHFHHQSTDHAAPSFHGTVVAETWPDVYMPAPGDTVQFTAKAGRPASVIDRGRPIEQRCPAADLPPRALSSRRVPQSENGDAIIQSPEITKQNFHAPEVPQLKLDNPTSERPAFARPRVAERLNAADPKRHSMYEATTTSSASTVAKARPVSFTTRSMSAAPAGRVQLPSKHGIAEPHSLAALLSPSATSGGMSQSIPPSRRISVRGGGTSNRLAWIRELEEKKSGDVNRDLGVLKKQAGSVSDKLAMFESKNTGTSRATGAPPLPRSNSSSRFSTAGHESVFSTDSNAATASPRTSIDTARTSHRASSIMNYYDDSFREKLENLVSGSGPEKDKNEPPKAKIDRAQAGLPKPEGPKAFMAEPEAPKPLQTELGEPEEVKPEESKPEESEEVEIKQPEEAKPEKPEEPQEVKPEVTPEVKPAVKPEEVTPKEITPEVTTEVTPEVTPEVKPEEVMPEVAPEVVTSEEVTLQDVTPEEPQEIKVEEAQETQQIDLQHTDAATFGQVEENLVQPPTIEVDSIIPNELETSVMAEIEEPKSDSLNFENAQFNAITSSSTSLAHFETDLAEAEDSQASSAKPEEAEVESVQSANLQPESVELGQVEAILGEPESAQPELAILEQHEPASLDAQVNPVELEQTGSSQAEFEAAQDDESTFQESETLPVELKNDHVPSPELEQVEAGTEDREIVRVRSVELEDDEAQPYQAKEYSSEIEDAQVDATDFDETATDSTVFEQIDTDSKEIDNVVSDLVKAERVEPASAKAET